MSLGRFSNFKCCFQDVEFSIIIESFSPFCCRPLVVTDDQNISYRQSSFCLPRFCQFGAEETEGRPSSEEESDSSDDEHTWAQEVKEQHRQLQREDKLKATSAADHGLTTSGTGGAKFMELKDGENYGVMQDKKKKRLMK